MESFSSCSLKNYLKEKSELNHEENMKICRNIYEAVSFLHSNKIAHRDLSLSNILIDPKTLAIKIIDFGLSRSNFNTDEMFSFEGDRNYFPPDLEIFNNLFYVDLWSMCLVFLSILLREKMTSKRVCSMMMNSKKNYKQIENKKFLGVSRIFKNLEGLLQGKEFDFSM